MVDDMGRHDDHLSRRAKVIKESKVFDHGGLESWVQVSAAAKGNAHVTFLEIGGLWTRDNPTTRVVHAEDDHLGVRVTL